MLDALSSTPLNGPVGWACVCQPMRRRWATSPTVLHRENLWPSADLALPLSPRIRATSPEFNRLIPQTASPSWGRPRAPGAERRPPRNTRYPE